MGHGLSNTVGSKSSPQTSYRWLILAVTLVLSACGGSGGDGPDSDGPITTPMPGDPPEDDPNGLRDIVELDGVYAYVRNGRYANVLKSCALVDDYRQACTLDVLPFIVQDSSEPTVDDVMSRVLVSHDWMGERFETLLRTSNDSLTRMFGSVTSILIGSTVRPSNYWGGTGGIQLDPNYLWMSIDEKMTVSVEEDFRSGYGSELQFIFYQARMRDGNVLRTSFNLINDDTRTLEDIRIPTLRLLYHELAHANDYLPRTVAPLLDATLIPSAALDELMEFWMSPRLVADQPLNSSVLKGLAGVRYRGFEATDAEKTITATVVGSEIAVDGAAKFYSYRSVREDFATLVDTAMMKVIFDVDLAAGFVDIPADRDNAFCDDYTVGWGTRNRLSDPLVLIRTKSALELLFGASDGLDQFINDQLGTSDPMQPGNGWCAERDLRASPAIGAIASDGLQRRSTQRLSDESFNSEMNDTDRHAWAEQKRRR